MLFNSIIFWLFFIFVLLSIYINSLVTKSIKIQNYLLLISSYIFYGYWDYRFLILIFIVSLQTFIFGHLIEKKRSKSKIYLIISICLNIIILGFFKYFNFFIIQINTILNSNNYYNTLNIILPVGISFYIFQSLTYVIDIYNSKMKAEKKIINYLTYVSFFPQLVAGPIERARKLLPQFNQLFYFRPNRIYEGIKISIIGLFLKIVIADNLGFYTDAIFLNYKNLSGGILTLGTIYFSVQIYADFCGYSLIAIGVAKIMGFELSKNFNNPYAATSIQDFWRRWHISLSTFFRDYIYIPLGGSKHTKISTYKNILVTFVLSGLWHGANWTFIFWGFLNGIILIFETHFSKIIKLFSNKKISKFLNWLLTITIISFLWIIFRSESIYDAFLYINRIIFEFDFPNQYREGLFIFGYFLILEIIVYIYDYEKTWFKKIYLEIIIISVFFILLIGNLNPNKNFIYFQF